MKWPQGSEEGRAMEHICNNRHMNKDELQHWDGPPWNRQQENYFGEEW